MDTDEVIVGEITPFGYEYIRIIGNGSFGLVVLARDLNLPSQPFVALKLLPRGRFVRFC